MDDMARIWEYHAAARSVYVANSVLERLDETIRKTLLSFPMSGRLRPQLGRGIRSYPVVPYVVFYQTTSKSVEVLRILHGRRNIKPPLMSFLAAVSA